MAKPVSPARRRASLIVLCVLAPVLALLGWRAQSQWKNYQQADHLFHEANHLICNGRVPEAVPVLVKSIQLCPDMISSWDALAVCHLELKQEDAAIRVLLDAKSRFPHSFLIERSLGYAYKQGKMFKEAAACFDEAVKLDKDDPVPRYLRDSCLKEAAAGSQRTAN